MRKRKSMQRKIWKKCSTIIDKLNELDDHRSGADVTCVPGKQCIPEDVVTNGDGSKETLSNAPAQKDGGFKVPKTIGD